MSDEKPLHHRVAEALGWTHIGPGNLMDVNDPGVGYPPQYQVIGQKERVPRYDEDWGATGPVIERFGIVLNPGACEAWVDGLPTTAGGSPLEAVCNLILRIANTR